MPFFSKLKALLSNTKENYNLFLSKSTLKYIVYRQVFWIDVRRLQDQYISTWALVFYYYIFSSLPREKTIIQTLQCKLTFSKYVFF